MRIMRAAMACFTGRGFAATTVAAIVAEARMSRTTFYRHFVDREDVLVACLDHLLDVVVTVVGDTIIETTGQPDGQAAVIAGLLGALADHHEFAPVLLMETIGGSQRATARLWEVLDGLSALVTRSDRIAEERLGRPQLRLPMAETALVGALYMWICAHIRAGDLERIGRDPEVATLVIAATQAARAAVLAG